MRRYEIAFYPGVKEEDIPKLPRAVQEQFIYKLKELTEGKTKGAHLEARPSSRLEGFRKLHINDPKEFAKYIREKEQGRERSGGYRIIYREAEVRGKPAVLILAVGPRKGMAVYNVAEKRLAQQASSAQQTGLRHSSGKPLKPQAPQESNPTTTRRSSPPQSRGRSR